MTYCKEESSIDKIYLLKNKNLKSHNTLLYNKQNKKLNN